MQINGFNYTTEQRPPGDGRVFTLGDLYIIPEKTNILQANTTMENSKTKVQVQMAWPERLLNSPPEYLLHSGYQHRTYQKGDESRFFKIMELAGWSSWNDEKLKPWLYKILPDGWLMITREKDDKIVASSMATHDRTWIMPFAGEVGWTLTDPAHTGKGLERLYQEL